MHTESQSVSTTEESAPIQGKRCREPAESGAISGITGMGGNEVFVAKKQRKTCSDQGKKRGPKQHANQSTEPAVSS